MDKIITSEIVNEAIDELNSMLPAEDKLEKTDSTILLRSKGGKLDSLGLVNLVVITEQKVAEKTGKNIGLTNFETFASINDSINDVDSFKDYINNKLS